MNVSACISAASEAWSLLAEHPWRWLLVTIVFIAAAESLMFIPYIGFVTKLAIASILGAAAVHMFREASHGVGPSPLTLLTAFSLPISAQLALAFAALFPFVLGMAYLYYKGGIGSIAFFFGNVLKNKPPAPELFVNFKYIMHLANMPLLLLSGAIVVRGLSGLEAVIQTAETSLSNWLPVVLLTIIGIAFESLSIQLSSLFPKPVAVAVGGILVVLFVAWSFAVTYTVSVRAFGPPPTHKAA